MKTEPNTLLGTDNMDRELARTSLYCRIQLRGSAKLEIFKITNEVVEEMKARETDVASSFP